MTVPYTRSLPYVLRDQLQQNGARVAVYKVASVPDADHVRVIEGTSQVTIPRLSSYLPRVGEPAYCIVADTLILAIGAVGGQVDEPPLAHAEVTANVRISSTDPATATTVVSTGAAVYDGGPVILAFYTPWIWLPVAGFVIVTLWEGAELTRLSQAGGPAGCQLPLFASWRFTPSAGTHTYTVRAFSTVAGAFDVGAGPGIPGYSPPAYVRVVKAT